MRAAAFHDRRPDEAMRHALDGTAMLFVGSGVGFLSRTASDDTLPNGRGLADILHTKLGIEPGRHSLQRISQHAVSKLGIDDVLAVLRHRLKVSSVDERLQRLYNAPWQRIYTTNYDDAIEVSRRGTSIASSFTLRDDPMTAPQGAIVHLNGFIDAIRPGSLDADAVLTDVSYSINEFQDSEWARQFLIDIRTSRSVIFVGYSMSDLDIVRLLLSDEEIRKKTFIYVSPDTDEVDIDALSRYGLVLTGGFDDLYGSFADASSSYIPVRNAVFTELRKVEIRDFSSDISPAETVYRQLVYGRVAEREFLLSENPLPGVHYVGPRAQVDRALEHMSLGQGRDLFIHGELASGKSCACLLAAKHFLTSGYEVYIASHGPISRMTWRDSPHAKRQLLLSLTDTDPL